MGGYLDTYGAGEEKREKILHRLALWGGLALLTAFIVYFVFHFIVPNRSQRAEVGRFFTLLQAGDYKQAYAMWGCTDANPCRDYPFQAFLQDWGPKNPSYAGFMVLDGESCGSGVIVDVDAGKAGDKKIWVQRSNGVLSFTPPGMDRCPQGNRIYDFFRNLRYKMHGKTYQ